MRNYRLYTSITTISLTNTLLYIIMINIVLLLQTYTSITISCYKYYVIIIIFIVFNNKLYIINIII